MLGEWKDGGPGSTDSKTVTARGDKHATLNAIGAFGVSWDGQTLRRAIWYAMMRELPFGALITDSFVKKLKWETAKASADLPGALPCLCVEEQKRYLTVGRKAAERIDFGKGQEVVPSNRLLSTRPAPPVVVKERVWVLLFDKRTHGAEATFEIDGVKLHISRLAQAELKGATVSVVNDRIIVTHGSS
jgi:hypothetical protein